MGSTLSFGRIAAVAALGALTACGGFDIDMRGSGGQFDTSDAAQSASAARPEPDARGVISYPGYQVAVAARGETVTDIGTRLNLPPEELARLNGIPAGAPLREGEIIVLSRRVAEPAGTAAPGSIDVESIAGAAIDRAPGDREPLVPAAEAGEQPIRHKVQPGETAYSVARSYGVSVRALAEWNGLGPDLAVREGQFLLIPVAASSTVAAAASETVSTPGTGTVAPPPPSATAALPASDPKPAAAPPPQSAALDDQRTSASDTARLRMPVSGRIVRSFEKGKSDGIAIEADAGDPVVAADDGTVAAITRDTDQVPILVLRHAGNLLTVYAGVDAVTVDKGDRVKRGQKIAAVRAASPSFLHFEVREGFDSVDPLPYLK